MKTMRSWEIILFIFIFSAVSAFPEEEIPESDPAERYVKDVERQVAAGAKEIRKLAEKALQENGKASEAANLIRSKAAETRIALFPEETGYKAAPTPPDDEFLPEPKRFDPAGESVVTFRMLEEIVAYKLFSARRENGLANRMQQATQYMLRVFQKGEEADPKSRYYQERIVLEKKAVGHMASYQMSLQRAKNVLDKLRNLEATFNDATGRDFSEITSWKSDGVAATTTLEKIETDFFAKAFQETERTDYLMKNSADKDDAIEIEEGFAARSDPPDAQDDSSPFPDHVEKALDFALRTVDDPEHSPRLGFGSARCYLRVILTFATDMWSCYSAGQVENPPATTAAPGTGKRNTVKRSDIKRQSGGFFCAFRPVLSLIFGVVMCILIP